MKVNIFDIDDIDKAIDTVKSAQKAVRGISKEVMQKLVDAGVEKARDLCPFHSGETYESIHGYVTEDGKGVIVAGGHAAWIEFGTGVKGADSPYPGDKSFMKGATPYNGYISGDKIFETKNGDLGWYYYDDYLGEVYFTKGKASNPFMWLTAQHIRAIAPDVVKVEFKHLPNPMQR